MRCANKLALLLHTKTYQISSMFHVNTSRPLQFSVFSSEIIEIIPISCFQELYYYTQSPYVSGNLRSVTNTSCLPRVVNCSLFSVHVILCSLHYGMLPKTTKAFSFLKNLIYFYYFYYRARSKGGMDGNIKKMDIVVFADVSRDFAIDGKVDGSYKMILIWSQYHEDTLLHKHIRSLGFLNPLYMYAFWKYPTSPMTNVYFRRDMPLHMELWTIFCFTVNSEIKCVPQNILFVYLYLHWFEILH